MTRSTSYYKTRYNKTPEEIRKIFFTRQNQQCQLCEDNLAFGFKTCYDESSDSVVCKRCKLVLNSIRSLAPQFLEKALKLVKGEKVE